MPTTNPPTVVPPDWTLITGRTAQNFPRTHGNLTSAGVPGSGVLNFTSMYLTEGTVVNSISFVSGATGMTTGTNQWFCIYSLALAKLAVTVNDTNVAWAAQTMKTLAITGGYTIPSTGQYYIGVCVTATTTPTLMGLQPGNGAIMFGAMVPKLSGTSTTGLTTPATAPATAAAFANVDRMYYCAITT